MRKRIAIDQDQVLADLLGEWLQRYNNDYNDDLVKDDIKHWEWHDIVKPKCGRKIYDYLDSVDIFENLKVIENSIDAVKELSHIYDIFVVTSPWNMNNIKPKYDWLKQHFPFIDDKNYVFTKNKSIISADFMIDDKPENLEDFKGYKILFDAPHNQDISVFYRVKDWNEINLLL